MKFAVIDNNRERMSPDRGRGQGFAEALNAWHFGCDYEFVPYDSVVDRAGDLAACRGLILTGSWFDFALPGGRLDSEVYRKMTPELRLIRDFRSPVLGICFGHQLVSLAEEFQEGRSDFGELRIRSMRNPEEDYFVDRLRLECPLRFSPRTGLWVQNNHKQEVVVNDALLRHFDVLARSALCPVQVIQHKSREWFGVQFHPEIGKPSRRGDVARHDDALADGYGLIRDFVAYCLARRLRQSPVP